MKKPKSAPMDPATEINRAGIALLSGASLSRVGFVTLRGNWGFPDLKRKGQGGMSIYDLDAVKQWIKNNDLKNMFFSAADRKPLCLPKKEIKTPVITPLTIQLTEKPPQFKKFGTTTTVHLREQHEFSPPDPRLSRFSNNSDHRISSASGWQ